MILILDNAESILDPQGTNSQEIYAVVEELSQISNICLCFTSRISTIPPHCETIDIPTLSMEAARDTFYRIYKNRRQPDPVNSILDQLDFHPLSITLLATVAHHSKWDTKRLNKEWERQRTNILRTQHDKSLAATIELSLASPMFQELGPDSRELLGVIAFFPQGIDENNLDWLFPTISDGASIFDTFCILSLTYRNDEFITMLAPLRDYLCPKDPASSPLLRGTKDRYFRRLSVFVDPAHPGFEEARWITSEDVNVEHLLDAFTSIPTNISIWDTCGDFMGHLYWHKTRLVVLGPKIEALQDTHPSKPHCLFQLSMLYASVGNHAEYKRLLILTSKIWKDRKYFSFEVAQTLMGICDANRHLGLYKEGIEQAKEALEYFEQIDHILGRAESRKHLARLLYLDNQLDAAEEVALRAIDLLEGAESGRFPVCQCYHTLGLVCRSRGETEKAIEYFETALGIASSTSWHGPLFWGNHSLAELFFGENRFDEAHTHIERAKSHAIVDPYNMGHATKLQAQFWYKESRFKEARSEVLRAADIYEGIGATKDVEECRALLRDIEEAIGRPLAAPHE